MKQATAITAIVLLILASLPATTAAEGAVYFSDDMENGTGDWTASGLWHQTTDRAANGTAWYYGQSTESGTTDNNYDTGTANQGNLTSPAFTLGTSGPMHVSFWTYWDGEGCPYEHPIVLVRHADGAQTIADEWCASQGGAAEYAIDLTPFAGETIQLVFQWNTLDDIYNHFEGWYVDNVVVKDGEVPPPDVDLTVDNLAVSGSMLDGAKLQFTAELKNLGTQEPTDPFTVDWLIDGEVVAQHEYSPTRTGKIYMYFTVSGVGDHTFGVHVDSHDDQLETNETNNVASITFTVLPAADLTVNVTDLRRAPLVTEFGEVRHPLSRFEADVQVCNVGDAMSDWVSVNYHLSGEDVGSTYLSGEYFGGMDAGECVDTTVQFNAPGAIGDFTFHASVWGMNEVNHDNNWDTADSYNFVSGEGGILLPFGAQPT